MRDWIEESIRATRFEKEYDLAVEVYRRNIGTGTGHVPEIKFNSVLAGSEDLIKGHMGNLVRLYKEKNQSAVCGAAGGCRNCMLKTEHRGLYADASTFSDSCDSVAIPGYVPNGMRRFPFWCYFADVYGLREEVIDRISRSN